MQMIEFLTELQIAEISTVTFLISDSIADVLLASLKMSCKEKTENIYNGAVFSIVFGGKLDDLNYLKELY